MLQNRECGIAFIHVLTKLPRECLHAHAYTLAFHVFVLGILQLKQGERSPSSFKASTKDLILDFPEQLNYEASWSTGTLRVLDDAFLVLLSVFLSSAACDAIFFCCCVC